MPPRDYVAHSGGIFRDMVIHDFDTARFILGEEPVELRVRRPPGRCRPRCGIRRLRHRGVLLRTASGRQCSFNCCREAVYGYDQRLEVFGSAGMLRNDNLRATTIRRSDAVRTDAAAPLLGFFLERYADAYRNEMEAFLRALEDGTPMPTNPLDGRQALRLADAAVESVRTGRAVVV